MKSILFLIFFSIILIGGYGVDDNEVFKPTKNWQIVKKGQKIPPGLRVRVNFETGITEAKFDDESENKEDSALVEVKENEPKTIVVTPSEELQAQARGEIPIKTHTMHPVKKKTIGRVKQRKIKEFKFDDEKNVIDILVEKFTKSSNDEEKIKIVKDLEFVLHDIDAAYDFISKGGIKAVITKGLNSTNIILQTSVSQLIGAAAQSNPYVQEELMREGIVSMLLRSLSRGCHILDFTYLKCKSIIYALSCILRGLPIGQNLFVEEGGLVVFATVFDKVQHIEFQAKIIALVRDLLEESHSAEFVKFLIDHNWCEKFLKLLRSATTVVKAGTTNFEHSIIDQILINFQTISPHCKIEFSSNLPLFSHLLEYYSLFPEYSEEDDEKTIYGDIIYKLKYLIREINNIKKEEL